MSIDMCCIFFVFVAGHVRSAKKRSKHVYLVYLHTKVCKLYVKGMQIFFNPCFTYTIWDIYILTYYIAI